MVQWGAIRAGSSALARRVRAHPGPGWFVGAAAALVIRILIPGPVGLADNSDGRRLLCQLAAAPPRGWHDSAFWWHTQYSYTPGSAACPVSYRSSRLLILRLSSWLTRGLIPHEQVDLRIAGVLTVLLWAAAVALIHLGCPGRARTRALFAGGVLLVLLDSEFADYPISAYSEPAVITGFCFVLAGALWLRRPGRAGWLGALLLVGGASVLTTAKEQTLTVFPALILLLWLTPLAVTASRRRGAGLKAGMLAVILGVTALAPAGAAASARLTEQTRFNLVIDRVLPLDGHAAADLAALGLPASDTRYQGLPAWCAETLYPRQIPAIEAAGSLGYRTLADFLLRHPATTWRLLDYAAVSGFDQPRPTAVFCHPGLAYRLGDYPGAAHSPVRRDQRFTPVGLALRLLRPGGLPLLAVIWLGCLAGCRYARRRAPLRAPADLGLFTACTTAAQFVTAAFGDGVDDAKHMNLAVLAGAVTVLCTARCVLPILFNRLRRPARSIATPVAPGVATASRGAR